MKIKKVIDFLRKKYIKKKVMKCVKCGEEISPYWYYKKSGICGDYSYIGYCASCENLAKYTGNL